ncbi:MAG: tripartite tricarboxylate transporter TctB family protein [Treponemataceae bacterium]
MSRHALTVSFAALCLATAIVFFISSLKLPEAASQLPQILAGLIVFLSLGMVFESHLKSVKEKADKTAVSEKAAEKSDLRTPIFFALFVTAYVLLLQPVGYFIMTPAFIICSFIFLKSAKLPATLLTAFSFTIFVYLLFVLFLHLPIPMGILSGIL